MFPFPQRHADEPEGDFRRRQAFRALIVSSCLLALSVATFRHLQPIWDVIGPLEGVRFMVAATVLGMVLAAAPLVAVAAGLMAVWHAVESVERPRSRATPLLDRALYGIGLVVWFAPALGLLGMAGRAIATGAISFRRPAREYLLATDPIAFWQSIGFILIVAACVAYPAWHYWRRKFAARAGA